MIDVSLISPDMIAFGPDILHLVEMELQARNLTYRDVAERVHTATGTVGSWFSRGAIPMDKVWPVVAAIGSGRLWMQVLARLPGNAFRQDYLDVDHPKPLIEDTVDAAEKLLELSKTAQRIIRHKERGYVFDDNDDRMLKEFEDVLADVVLFGKMALVSIEDHYDRSVTVVMARQRLRMISKGYKKEKAPVLAHRRF